MKAKNTHESECDLDLEPKHVEGIKKEARWAIDISEQCARHDIKVPIVAKLGKGQKQAQVSFTTYASTIEIATLILENNRDKFRSLREVNRCCHYRGAYENYIDLGSPNRNHNNYQLGEFFEYADRSTQAMRVGVTAIASFVDFTHEILESFRMGIIDAKTSDVMIENIIQKLPQEMQNLARNKSRELKSGANVSDMYEHTAWGGKR
jgi:hypothetical protein